MDTPTVSDTVAVVDKLVSSREPATLVLALLLCCAALYAFHDIRKRYKDVDALRIGADRMYQLLIVLASEKGFNFELPSFAQLIDQKYHFDLFAVMRRQLRVSRREDFPFLREETQDTYERRREADRPPQKPEEPS